MAYPKALISIQIWHFISKCPRMKALSKAFYRCIKAFLAPKVRKSVLEKLVFVKSEFLVNFIFLDLPNFVLFDRFSILPSTLPPSAPLALLGAS